MNRSVMKIISIYIYVYTLILIEKGEEEAD